MIPNQIYDLKLVNKKNQINPHIEMILEKYPEYLEIIKQYVHFHPGDLPPKALLYCIIKDVSTRPACKLCGSFTQYAGSYIGFNMYCGVNCVRTDKEKYKNARTKAKQTNLERFGVPCPMQHPDIMAKRTATNQAKYGVDYPLQNKDILKKTHVTMIETYGGVGFQSQVIQETNYKNTVERNGHGCPSTPPLSAGVRGKLTDPVWMSEQHITLKKSLGQIGEEIGCATKTAAIYLHKLGIETHHHFKSKYENYLYQFISQHYSGTINANDRSTIKPKELDIYLPDLKLAIEFNGLYRHGEYFCDNKHMHIEKTQLCEQLDIRLIHIFEHEWHSKHPIVMSRLLSAINRLDKIHARKTTIVVLTSKQHKEFFNTTHIQGPCSASVCYGLMYQGEIVAAMSFGKSRFNSQYQYELLRFSNKLNTTVVGGANKLLKHFMSVHTPSSIVSYCDKRWGTGQMYKAIGFTYVRDTPPNYWYFRVQDPTVVYSRQQFQKHKLPMLLPSFDPTLSEAENMMKARYDRVWDCGSQVYELIL